MTSASGGVLHGVVPVPGVGDAADSWPHAAWRHQRYPLLHRASLGAPEGC